MNCLWARTNELMNKFHEIWMMSVDNPFVFIQVIGYDAFNAIHVIWHPRLHWLVWECDLVEVAPTLPQFILSFNNEQLGLVGIGMWFPIVYPILRLGGLPLKSPKGLLSFYTHATRGPQFDMEILMGPKNKWVKAIHDSVFSREIN